MLAEITGVVFILFYSITIHTLYIIIISFICLCKARVSNKKEEKCQRNQYRHVSLTFASSHFGYI
jgi:heme/copper-type cytochrome/quinol oxidase subunit 2